MNITKNLYWVIYFIFLVGACAKQTSPTGGPKDTIPPRPVKVTPMAGSTNFQSDNIAVEFTELIQANNAREEILITPSIGNEFELVIRRNIARLDFNAPLDSNTTYTVNFRESIQDITERNPVRNLQIAFSTGSYLDSLSIEGYVYDMFTGLPVNDATVAIHAPNDTFSIFDHVPQFLTKTNKKGYYRIDNLKHGSYYPYAFTDKNRNLKVDSRSEAYGFFANPIVLSTDTSAIDLYLIRLDARPLTLTSARPYNTYFNIKTNKNLKTFRMESSSEEHLSYGFGTDRSNILLYNTLHVTDSLEIRFVGEDSIGFSIDTTLFATFSTRQVTPERFSTAIEKTTLLSTKGQLAATITFTKPITSINFDSIYFQYDSATRYGFLPEHVEYNEPTKLLTLARTIPPETPPADPVDARLGPPSRDQQSPATKKITELVLGHGAFISADTDTSARISQKVQSLSSQNLAWIIFDIRTSAPSYIVQLVDRSGKLIQQKRNTANGQFEDLSPGEYRLRVVIDSNANGVWDPGNYYNKTEPEKIFYYHDERGKMSITTKANFEIQLAPMWITY